MKKVVFICLFIFMMVIQVNAKNELNISEPISNQIKNLGINIKNVEFDELVPNEFTTYGSFKKRIFKPKR